MSDWREKLKASQGEGSAYPDFLKNIQGRFEMKDNGKGETAFSYWDKEKEGRIFISKGFSGVLIGSAMVLSAYSDNIGVNGGTITSSVFYSYKDRGVAFSMGKKVIEGTMADIKDYMYRETGGVKNLRVYFVLTAKGIYQISTNISFSIFEINKLEPGVFQTHLCTLTPSTYDPEDKQFDNGFKKILGKFASKNKPRYASISVGAVITDELAKEFNLVAYLDKYEEWKEFTTQGNVADEGEINGAEKSQTSEQEVDDANNGYQHTTADAPPMEIEGENPSDDLPF